jgi:hypothetical protein
MKISERTAELTSGELQIKLRAAGYVVAKPPGSSKAYYKDGA